MRSLELSLILNEEALRLALKVLGGMYSFPLTVEEMEILGVDRDSNEGEICRHAEDILARMIMAISREANNKTPRIYGEQDGHKI